MGRRGLFLPSLPPPRPAPVQLGIAEVGPGEIGVIQVYGTYLGITQIGVAEHCTTEGCPVQIGADQEGTRQVGVAQIGTVQQGTAEVGADQLGVAPIKPRADLRRVASCHSGRHGDALDTSPVLRERHPLGGAAHGRAGSVLKHARAN